MEEEDQSSVLVAEGAIKSIKLSLSTENEICTYSINDCPVTHPSQLGNPFLGLPLETGKCESCGATENGKCEGHFGFIELPVPVYHPCHVSELRQLLSMVCLQCLRIKKGKVKQTNGKENFSVTACHYCRGLPALYLKEIKTADGAFRLELRAPPKKHMTERSWDFLGKYGFRYGGASHSRTLLPEEALNILKKIPDDTKKKLAARGYIAQPGYVMKYLPVPPNCLYIPEFTDGQSIMSYDISISLLKKILQKIEQIKKSRSGSPNFESNDSESTDLQLSIGQYIQLRGTTKGPQDAKRFSVSTDSSHLSTKQWLEKMRTLFISKGSGFSSRSVLTGDPYIGADVVGLPSEVAKRITFEEQVTDTNLNRLQEVVDKGLCLTYRDGQTTYAITVGSKGYTTLKVGQTISRRIVDGDVVFLNRPPSTHKHSLQAFTVYIHDDHTVKINPLICSPLAADFDGDCVHIYYPQSLAAKAEALELFSVEKQLTNSHNGKVNLQLANDSLLALKHMSSRTMLSKESANQLAMLLSLSLPAPAVVKSKPCWTITQIMQSALPAELTCEGDRFLVRDSTVIKLDLDKESIQASFSELVSSILAVKGPGDALKFLNALQPFLMEFLLLDGFSVSLQDFSVPKPLLEEAQECIKKQSLVLEQSRCSNSQSVEVRVDNNLKDVKQQIADFVVKSSRLGLLIDPKSDPSVSKVVQQLAFVGPQLYREGKFYSRRLVDDCFSSFVNRHPPIEDGVQHPPEAYGLVQSAYFHGLNPYEELVHSICTRETIVRSSRGLTEPGTLFKSLMAILRDVVICYDGTVRNICSNSIMQLKYKEEDDTDFPSAIAPGEPVGVLAATAISNPAYKAVLDASQSNNTSWELMKEILKTKVSYKNDAKDRKVILFLNDCSCPKKFCKEKAAIAVQGCLKRVTLEDCATDICIEYHKQVSLAATSEAIPAFVGHIHLEKAYLEKINVSIDEILHKCQEVSGKHANKKGTLGHLFKKITFSTCDCSFTQKPGDEKVPCLQFSFSEDIPMLSDSVEKAVNVLADSLCSVLLEIIIKGDPRVQEAKITWVGSDATSWVKHTKKISKGEPAVEIIVEKKEAMQNGDAWRIAMDACIPVMNLIDTQRSIPYGIQQVRELLGISCSFDQVVQRLSKTMKTVAKGILKDHLVLVANSMTCTGNLNGFHNGGYKATFRSLKVQVPFTEATLLTPMKCFEKAAEKCHSDSLGSVVSSCSWGKHAALGTGSSFQILWNENQLKSNKEYGDGLYDFLALVRTDQEKAAYTFLDDVDYLVEDNAMDDFCLSPELDGTHGMPTFEDNPEEQTTENGSSWENGTTANANAGNDSGNWGGGPAVENDSTDWAGWGNDKKTVSVEPAEPDTWADQGAKKDTEGGWSNAAAKPAEQDKSCWNAPPTVENNSSDWAGWGTGNANDRNIVSEGPAEVDTWADQSGKRDTDGGGASWDKMKVKDNNMQQDQWGHVPTQNVDAQDDPWGSVAAVAQPSTAKHMDANNDSWGSVAAKAQTSTAEHMDANNDSWGSVAAKTSTAEPMDTKDDSWGSVAAKASIAEPMDAGNDSWGSVAAKAQTSTAQQESWGNVSASPSDNAWGAAPVSQGPDNSDAKQPDSWDGWGSAPPVSQGPDNSDAKQPDSWDGWGSAQANESSTDKWKTNASGNNKGWKSDGWEAKENRRDQRDNPGRPPMRPPVERPPRPRYELPAEAKKVLQEIEPIVTTVRKIFRESSDGIRLPLEDEKFIIEKVLEHHPEKEKKVSGEIDHIMVNKHHIFQDSRCFYVVSSDGTQTDFSYIKCMDNYVRKNHEEHAELICEMHFKKRNRDRPPVVDGGAAPPTEAGASQPTPGERLEAALPGPPPGTPPPSAITQQEGTPASPGATPEDDLPLPPPPPPPLTQRGDGTPEDDLPLPPPPPLTQRGDGTPEDDLPLPPPPPLPQQEAETPGSAPEAGGADDKWGAGGADDEWGAGGADDKWV
ncbi:DNA-directed RNA polymerase V subunit 1 isoform X1 [Hordeum vulgare subsp. vulgare]|uniref:DNA-directed RNA polymerase V subunit 1 isoform X1 n=1 Tax=Hordeum vulgare subsp. vulgare TaxID=112509 RepID=UPI000B46E7C5|nr:DNA-directed RNA polymerase V subunit 1 isoform X1 [Hordeum vulgare subsp. vulgare]XP_044951358.1 DNA-directed RNA polymerase V subunit 1 isoform X1 [Hordeum vulgare subsp. vulgare]